MVANNPPIFLPRLVPHVFSHGQVRHPTSSRTSRTRHTAQMSSLDSHSPRTPMSVTSDSHHVTPMSVTSDSRHVILPVSRSTSSPVSINSDPTFLPRSESPSHSESSTGTSSSHLSANRSHDTILLCPQTLSLLNLAAVNNNGVQSAAHFFLSYYQVRPQDVIAAITLLASGNNVDHANLYRLLHYIFDEDQIMASAILHDYLTGQQL